MTPKEPKYKYGSTQVNLPAPLAKRLKAWARQWIGKDILAGDGYETNLHITVKYGIKTEEPLPALKAALAPLGPLTAHLSTVQVFDTSPDFDVLYVSVTSDDLAAANKAVKGAVECDDTHPQYTPHITLAYVEKGKGYDLAGSEPFLGEKVTFDTVMLSSRSGRQFRIALTGENAVLKGINEGLHTHDAAWWRWMELKKPRSGMITIHRGVSTAKGTDADAIRPGDWVSTSRPYAKSHGSKVLTQTVPLDHVVEASTNSPKSPEFFYRPTVKKAIGLISVVLRKGIDKSAHTQSPYADTSEMVPISTVKKYREYDRSQSPRDPHEFAALKSDIHQHGIKEPLMMEYQHDKKIAILGEGNHRLAAAEQLGHTHVPVRVARSYSVEYRDGHKSVPGYDMKPRMVGSIEYPAHLPSNIKPSEIGLPTEEHPINKSVSHPFLGVVLPGGAVSDYQAPPAAAGPPSHSLHYAQAGLTGFDNDKPLRYVKNMTHGHYELEGHPALHPDEKEAHGQIKALAHHLAAHGVPHSTPLVCADHGYSRATFPHQGKSLGTVGDYAGLMRKGLRVAMLFKGRDVSSEKRDVQGKWTRGNTGVGTPFVHNPPEFMDDSEQRCINMCLRAFGLAPEKRLYRCEESMKYMQAHGFKCRWLHDIYDGKTGQFGRYGSSGPTFRAFANSHPDGKFMLFNHNHAVALIDGKMIDTEGRGFDGRRITLAFEVTGEMKKSVELAACAFPLGLSKSLPSGLKAGDPHPTMPHLAPSDAATRSIVKERGHAPVPPASWGLHVSPDPEAKVQATWHDAAGRRQSRYHSAHSELAADHKYKSLAKFHAALPHIRAQVTADLHKPDASPDRVKAAVVHLMDHTALRVGSEKYAEENGTFGASSLRKNHVELSQDGGATHAVKLVFNGKHGKSQVKEVHDPLLYSAVSHLMEQPGERLFQQRTKAGGLAPVTEKHINDYLGKIAPGVHAHQFRTYHGTRIAAQHLLSQPHTDDPKIRAKIVKQAMEKVSQHLGNTPVMAQKSYVSPEIVHHYMAGTLKPEHLME